ncbi:MAG: lyase family protein, partial [Planctomycetota bacterium]
IDYGPDGAYDMRPIEELVNEWTGGNPRGAKPYLAAKWLLGRVVEHVQPSAPGFNNDRGGSIEGLDVQGAAATAVNKRGSAIDMALLLTAVYREAGIPARLVVGYDAGSDKEQQRFLKTSRANAPEIRAWVEFALFDEAAGTLTWIPADPHAMRKSSSRIRPNFMERLLCAWYARMLTVVVSVHCWELLWLRIFSSGRRSAWPRWARAVPVAAAVAAAVVRARAQREGAFMGAMLLLARVPRVRAWMPDYHGCSDLESRETNWLHWVPDRGVWVRPKPPLEGNTMSASTATNESSATRTEKDSMGEMLVPADVLFGASTQRAVLNFPISGRPVPADVIRAFALLKSATAHANAKLGRLDGDRAAAIDRACAVIGDGLTEHGGIARHFPVDIFQTGSGTSTNMNTNEVIANLVCLERGKPIGSSKDASYLDDGGVHPNDHANMGQSSNDTFPTAMHIAASVAIKSDLLPAIDALATSLEEKAKAWDTVVKIGRTHLQDATPIRLGQEFSGYAAQMRHAEERLHRALHTLGELAIGGTAVGTGLNSPQGWG